jgi:SAM-dependent methyltransferase
MDFVHSNLGFSDALNPKKAFEQVHRILKPGGIFLFTSEGPLGIPNNFKIIKKKESLELNINWYLLRKEGTIEK